MADPNAGQQMLTIARWFAGLAGAGVGIPLLYRGLRTLYDDVYERLRKWRHDRLTLARIADQNELHSIRAIPPDERGRYPLLYGKGGILRDPNNLRAFTLQAVRETWPELEHLDAVVKAVAAAGGWPTLATAEHLLPEQQVNLRWPGKVGLDDLLTRYHHRPSLHHLLLGITLDAQGSEKPVVGDLQAMVHVLVSGASGFGKSTLLEAIAKQLVLAGDCDLCFVDYGINTFGMLGEHALYPIADTPGMAVALFKALIEELERRKGVFKEYPRVKDLDQFNATTGANLRQLVCFVDESASLFHKDGTKGPAIELAQMGRKYGLGLVLAGTDFKADTLPTEATGNCGARIALHLRRSLSFSLLGCKDAAMLRHKGRALASLPGIAELVEMQCPIVERWDDLPPARPTIELQPEPGPGDPLAADDPSLPDEERVYRLHNAGMSDTAIARTVFRYGNPHYIQKVRAILEERDVVVARDDRDAPEGGGAGSNDNNNTEGE